MARILVAASPKPREILERVLSGHELTRAETMQDAEQSLRKKSFDLIICTILFDESRMLDFLRLAKSRAQWKSIPFVCARVKALALNSPLALEAVAIASRSLGAEAFLDVADFRANPDREMRSAVEQLLNSTKRREGQ